MASAFIAMVAVIDFGAGTLGEGLFAKQVDGVAQVLVAGPPGDRASAAGRSGLYRSGGSPARCPPNTVGLAGPPRSASGRRRFRTAAEGASLGPAPGKEPNRSWSGWRPKSSSMR
jgi:hypothetical protein